MEQSALRFISMAMVTMNKVRESKVAYVAPYELIPATDGELTNRKNEIQSEGVDHLGSRYAVSLTMGEDIEAMWMGSEGSDTAPDVQRGESVELWQYADTEIYFWRETGRHNHLRRLETKRKFFSNISDLSEDVTELNATNSYGYEISTHDKHITLTTNKYDGEPFAYTFQINTGDGNWTFTDDARNIIQVDSANRIITFHNNDGTQLRLDKKNIIGYAPDSWYMHAENNIEFKCGKDFIISVGANYNKTIGGTYLCKAGGSHTTEAATITMKASKVTSDAPLTQCTGHLQAVSVAVGGGGARAASAETFSAGKSSYQAIITGTLLVTGETVFQSHATFLGGITTTTINADSGQFGSINHNSHSHP